ncbi:hypothetical protein NUW58_g8182 [Xylaria curta]|uniref:Uncharacterized protein n=1 Tax=Xylaria curta TaxID=42375 RepID=A0ACC1NB08_9PEZI|nr:hypothetical protein NUW58_g8182 [Xylaria curta]
MATQQDAGTPASRASGSVAVASTSKPDPSSSSSTPNEKADAPADSSNSSLPFRDKAAYERILIDKAISRDHINAAALIETHTKQNKHNNAAFSKIQEYKQVRNEYRPWFPPSKLYGEGYSGYGNGRTEIGAGSRLLYPPQKPRPGGKRQTPPLKWKRKDMKQQAEQHEELVPFPPELFAMQFIEDMELKPPVAQPVYDEVLKQLHEQLNDFYPFVFSDEDALDPELPYSAWKNDEMRILVKLNITIGQHTLVDQFEWEINNPLNSPEEFAISMSKDLALSGEFTTAIAHCIREQTQLFTRSLYIIGHPFDGRPIEDPDLVAAFLPSPLSNVFRPQQQAKDYSPYLYELNEVGQRSRI